MRLSPSKLSKFLTCPKSYEFKYVLDMEEESGQAAINGTFVHSVFEALYGLDGPSRTLARALEISADFHKDDDYDLEPQLEVCQEKIWNLFDLEDPTMVNCRRTEMDLELPWGDHTLKGIIDRVDVEEDGYVIVDYKSGKAPDDKHLSEKALGIKLYALMGLMAFGQAPVRVKLLYLGTPQAITFDVSPSMLRAVEAKAKAGVESIERGVFVAKPGLACSWCSFKDNCDSALTIKRGKRKVKE